MADTLPPAVPLGAVHHAAYRCQDAEQTRWFYEDVLGLPCAAGIVLEEQTGTNAPIPYMHIFFELGDGNYIAFFDSPGDAAPDAFSRKESFDLHIAIQAQTIDEMLQMQARIRAAGVKCAGPLDHGFVKSVYMYDPNGVQVEITVRSPDHDAIMADERAHLGEALAQWSQRTRAEKVAKFGATALDRRTSAPRNAA